MDAGDISALVGGGLGAFALGYAAAMLLTFLRRLLDNI